jgi:hypothetical protein
MPGPERKPSEAEQRAAVPAAMQAAKAAEGVVDTAAAAADAVSPRVEHAAERMQDAAEALVDEITDAAGDLKTKSSTRLCPHCKGELLRHGEANPYKAGAWHCNGCGCCFLPGIRELRAGHMSCAQASA